MQQIRFDFNNMFSGSIGELHGVTAKDLLKLSKGIKACHKHLSEVISDPDARVRLGLEWAKLPYQDRAYIAKIQKLGNYIARNYENVIFLGIGGSYLGLKAAQDALTSPYYNEFPASRRKRPRIYFDGNNLDPDTLSILLKNL
ncbi:MAG: hypothetical protein FJZ12_03900, partial [Candidatus Omnitrophica bacterium]|nr:hypothetical protein [Candidatus Omnitrophota bacterium]